MLDQVDLSVAAGIGLRAARPERGRQDHDGPHPLHADPGRLRLGAYRRSRRGRRRRRGAGVIGVTGQFSAVDNLLTGDENLRLMADLRHLGREAGQRRVAELLEQFELTDAADKLLSTYSGGMRRRLDLAMTLVGQPQVIFLDEPTTGLDPRSRLTMWEIIRELAAAGVTILLTTQYLDEADQLADRIVVLDHGRIVAEGTPVELKGRIPGGHIRLHFARPDQLQAATELLPAAASDAGAARPSGSRRRQRGFAPRAAQRACTAPTSTSNG